MLLEVRIGNGEWENETENWKWENETENWKWEIRFHIFFCFRFTIYSEEQIIFIDILVLFQKH